MKIFRIVFFNAMLCCIGAFLSVGCAVQFDRYGLEGVRFVLDRPIASPFERSARKPVRCNGAPFVRRPTEGEDTLIDVVHEMNFEGEALRLELQVSNYLYRATLASLARCDFDDLEEISMYYQTFTEQPAMIDFYDRILSPLREIRQQRAFDDATFARFIVRFVQSFGYCDQITGAPKPPVATVVEGCGDCDEKSVLLAGLLAAENYDVALFVFDGHMAVGLGTEGEGFSGTDYLYAEATVVTRVGLPDNMLVTKPLLSLIPIGTGTLRIKPTDSDARIEEIAKEVLSKWDSHKGNINDASISRFSGIQISMKDAESAKASILRHTTRLSHSEKMYLVYACILKYIIYSPHSEADTLKWLEEMTAWSLKLEAGSNAD
ncbi:MAG: hypothetical protein JXR76_00025 [Deltaproteobacteria bacterium]|nr:hypothetical protein [Deltaproteobacteria bacterium]